MNGNAKLFHGARRMTATGENVPCSTSSIQLFKEEAPWPRSRQFEGWIFLLNAEKIFECEFICRVTDCLVLAREAFKTGRAHPSSADKFRQWFHRLDMAAENLEGRQNRYGQDHSDNAPHPAPES